MSLEWDCKSDRLVCCSVLMGIFVFSTDISLSRVMKTEHLMFYFIVYLTKATDRHF